MVDPKFSVFLFIGEEKHLKHKAVEALRSSIPGNTPDSPDYRVFYGSESGSREILESAQTLPFSSSRKLIVIKDFEKLPQEDKGHIINYISKPSGYGYIVLDVKDDSALRGLERMQSHITVRRFDAADNIGAVSWIKKEAGAIGKKIDDDAAEAIVELRGMEFSNLKSELEKLTSFTGDRGTISLEDVETVTGRSFTGSAFDIIWAVGSRDAGKAVALVRDLALSGKRPQEVIGIISWHLKRLMKARIMKDGGSVEYAIMSGLGIQRRYSRDFFRQLESMDIDAIRSKMDILLKADLDIKNSRFDQALIFETAIIRLSALANNSQ